MKFQVPLSLGSCCLQASGLKNNTIPDSPTCTHIQRMYVLIITTARLPSTLHGCMSILSNWHIHSINSCKIHNFCLFKYILGMSIILDRAWHSFKRRALASACSVSRVPVTPSNDTTSKHNVMWPKICAYLRCYGWESGRKSSVRRFVWTCAELVKMRKCSFIWTTAMAMGLYFNKHPSHISGICCVSHGWGHNSQI